MKEATIVVPDQPTNGPRRSPRLQGSPANKPESLGDAQKAVRQRSKSPEKPTARLRGGVRVVEARHGRPTQMGKLETYLRVPVNILDANGDKELYALVDTGAEVNLIRTGILPSERFQPSERPLRLVMANNQRLSGGTTETIARLEFLGRDLEGSQRVRITAPTALYEADIEEDIILSYQWLGERGVDVCPRRHGLRTTVAKRLVWIAGERTTSLSRNEKYLPTQPMYVRTVKPTSNNRPKMLDLFCGRKSASNVLKRWGYETITLDNDPKRNPDIHADILTWDYRAAFPKGYFSLITASPPCTEFSRAKTIGERNLDLAHSIVRRTLEIIEYFAPPRWWLETPQHGILASAEYMQKYSRVDLDYCQFEECGYQKPTRFFGSDHLEALNNVKCNQRTCTSLVEPPEDDACAVRRHRKAMGGKTGCVHREKAYHIPEEVIEYVSGLLEAEPPKAHQGLVEGQDITEMSSCSPEMPLRRGASEDEETVDSNLPKEMEETEQVSLLRHELRFMRLKAEPTVTFGDELTEEEMVHEVINKMTTVQETHEGAKIRAVKMGPETNERVETDQALELQKALIKEFGATSLSGKYKPDPPERGPFGTAEIWLKPDAKPVSIPPFRIGANSEKGRALADLVAKCEEAGKLEDGQGPWNTPAFPVPKKVPGQYRLVQDLRPQNEATIKDGHPLPRIGDIVQKQGKHRVWTTLDLVDGFHQMPMRKEHRYITCMSTPNGTKQWKVLVMGLKNAGSQFQRMMEWVLKDIPDADPYIDDVIIGGSGDTEEDALKNCYEAVRAVLKRFQEQGLVCHPEKSDFFQKEIQFCGHILREGRRSPAPGKLLPLQKWELPQTVTELRAFLGLANYFSEYVDHYAELAAALMGKLKLNRQEGKKGSKMRVVWTEAEVEAFTRLKAKMCEQLELWQVDLDKPFRLRCDASDQAIGAELQQEIDGKWKPVALFSRKLTQSQLNWTPREKETYAIVAALRKWAGTIGFQPVESQQTTKP